MLFTRHRRKLRARKSDPNDTASLGDRRRVLSQAIRSLSSPQRVYMPGASALLDEVDPSAISEAPETVKLWFPSQLPFGSREESCVPGLPHLELRLRLAQAYDSLDLIRRLHGVYHVLLTKNKVHVSSSQGTMTRTKSLFTNFSFKIDQAAAKYREARIALTRLDPNEQYSDWKKDLRELRREDIRGPARETKEMSESQREVSWIWRTSSLDLDAGINDPALRNVMRTEWCKATARAQRFEEEVEIVVEEMRRTLAFFEWAAADWERRAKDRIGEPRMDDYVANGLVAYSARKAAHFRQLIAVFIQDWYHPLDRKSLGSSWLKNYPCPETV
jgi:hypothetical protein